MTARFTQALRPFLAEVEADCAVFWSHDSQSPGIVLGTLPTGLLAEGDPWPDVAPSVRKQPQRPAPDSGSPPQLGAPERRDNPA